LSEWPWLGDCEIAEVKAPEWPQLGNCEIAGVEAPEWPSYSWSVSILYELLLSAMEMETEEASEVDLACTAGVPEDAVLVGLASGNKG
jgi:hypothetical protein